MTALVAPPCRSSEWGPPTGWRTRSKRPAKWFTETSEARHHDDGSSLRPRVIGSLLGLAHIRRSNLELPVVQSATAHASASELNN
jgi:hypothetical protein